MGSLRECTRILGLHGYRVTQLEWEADDPRARVRIWIERRGIRGAAIPAPAVDAGRGGCGTPKSDGGMTRRGRSIPSP